MAIAALRSATPAWQCPTRASPNFFGTNPPKKSLNARNLFTLHRCNSYRQHQKFLSRSFRAQKLALCVSQPAMELQGKSLYEALGVAKDASQVLLAHKILEDEHSN
jgi:hypothetical protein